MFADFDDEVPPKAARPKPKRTSERSGLILPVARFNRRIRKVSGLPRCGKPAAVYLTAVIEYMLSEVLESAGLIAKECKKHRITPRHINLAIRTDQELEILLRKTIISGGGVFTAPKGDAKEIEPKEEPAEIAPKETAPE